MSLIFHFYFNLSKNVFDYVINNIYNSLGLQHIYKNKVGIKYKWIRLLIK